jgi:hypothetical protein
MPPHWLDATIEIALQTGLRDPSSLGRAIGGCERMQEAIRVGLADYVPGRLGLSEAQMIREAIMEAMEAGGDNPPSANP